MPQRTIRSHNEHIARSTIAFFHTHQFSKKSNLFCKLFEKFHETNVPTTILTSRPWFKTSTPSLISLLWWNASSLSVDASMLSTASLKILANDIFNNAHVYFAYMDDVRGSQKLPWKDRWMTCGDRKNTKSFKGGAGVRFEPFEPFEPLSHRPAHIVVNRRHGTTLKI